MNMISRYEVKHNLTNFYDNAIVTEKKQESNSWYNVGVTFMGFFCFIKTKQMWNNNNHSRFIKALPYFFFFCAA